MYSNEPKSSRNENRNVQQTIFGRLPRRIRAHTVAMIGEFVGTFMFLFFAFSGTQIANTLPTTAASSASNAQVPNTSALLYISLAFGFSLAVNAWVFFRITGGLFNPAVTLGMCMIGAVPWFRGILVFISQVVAGIAAAAVVSALFPGALKVTVGLSADTSIVRGLFIEMFLTAELVFTIFMLAAEKHKATFIAPIGIGLALFIAEMSGVFFTGGALNPTRALGPAVVNASFHGYDWIYWVGPFLGTLVAVGFYKLVKALEYETANPGQDANAREAEGLKEEEDDGSSSQHGRDGAHDNKQGVPRRNYAPPSQPMQSYNVQTYPGQPYMAPNPTQSYPAQNNVQQHAPTYMSRGMPTPSSQPSMHASQELSRGLSKEYAQNPRYSRRSDEAYV